MKGHMQDGKFHPHTDYKKGTRKSRDQKVKTQGVKIERNARDNGLENYQFHSGRKGSGSINSFPNHTKAEVEKARQERIKMFEELGHPLSVGKITRGRARPTEGTGLQKRFATSVIGTFKDKHGKIHHVHGYGGSHANLEQMPMKMFEVGKI